MFELVKKWEQIGDEESAYAKTGCSGWATEVAESNGKAFAYYDCSEQLEAALAKAWPWRSVKDELPELGRPLLLYKEGEIVSGRLTGRTWFIDGITIARIDGLLAPTHWMYADEIPRPGGEDG